MKVNVRLLEVCKEMGDIMSGFLSQGKEPVIDHDRLRVLMDEKKTYPDMVQTFHQALNSLLKTENYEGAEKMRKRIEKL